MTLTLADAMQAFRAEALRIAYTRTQNAADAEDVVQEAFCRAWSIQRAGGYQEQGRADHWLSAIVSRVARDFVRSRDTRERRLEPITHEKDWLHDHTAPDLERRILAHEVVSISRRLVARDAALIDALADGSYDRRRHTGSMRTDKSRAIVRLRRLLAA